MSAQKTEKRRKQIREASRRYRIQHPEKAKASRRESMRKWRELHLEEAKRRKSEWEKKNPETVRARSKRYRDRHRVQIREKAKEQNKRYRQAHREDRLRWHREWYKRSAAKAHEWQRNYGQAHQAERMIRNAIHHMFRFSETGKHCRAVKYVGCSPAFLRMHLEKQFRPGMTWENYGTVWHVDHIMPVSRWDLKNKPENLFRASHYSNLQPLFAGENLRKGNRP